MSRARLPLRRVARIINGGTPTPDDENWQGDVPWATPADFGSTLKRISKTRRSLTPQGLRAGSSLAPAESILLSTRAPIGNIAINAVPMAFNQGCRAIIPFHENDSRFLGYQLESLRDFIAGNGLGTTFVELSSESLAALEIDVPDPIEQRRIANFLDVETSRIDTLTARRREMRKLLALKRERVIEEHLGVEASARKAKLVPLKFLAMDVTVGIVITPAKWYVDGGGVPALRGTNVKPGRINLNDMVQISMAAHAENQKSRLYKDDVVVVRTGQAGAAAVVPPELENANCIDLILIRPGKKLDSKYIQYVLNSDYARRQVSEYSVGSIQAHFNVGAMKQIPVPELPRTEQEKVVKMLDEKVGTLDRLARRLAEQESLLAERRQALITAVVTGQVDVSTASGRGIED